MTWQGGSRADGGVREAQRYSCSVVDEEGRASSRNDMCSVLFSLRELHELVKQHAKYKKKYIITSL